MTTDELRSARLLFALERAQGAAGDAELEHPAVRRAVRARRVPPRPLRLAQRVRMRLGRLDYERHVAAPMAAARRAVLGGDADAPPRFLIRMDEYPHYLALDRPGEFGDEPFGPWRSIMAEAGCKHLIAVVPRPSLAPMDPAAVGGRELDDLEVARLAQLAGDGVAFGLHGYDHRTVDAHPRRQAELTGHDEAALHERLERGEEILARRAGLRPRVFVPPFNRFEAGQYNVLARRYDVVCGGPESVRLLGFHHTPQWRGEAVWLPAYAPLYGTAQNVLPAAEAHIRARDGLWIPIVLHWGWEAEQGWEALRRLADRLAPYAAGWDDFLAAVDASRQPIAA